ncbi:M15 family metallopeptidase [Marivirga sp.]|uniref:M15 family metallopeptidase n=1 Tax=Marivirga sp. TaxID=2018662 RepID=UPI003DA76D1A
MYRFGSTSIKKLSTCREEIQQVMKLAIQRSPIDFGISKGHRSVEEQQELYSQGRTKPGHIITYVDGVNKKSEHNKKPSNAVDIYGWVNRQATWDKDHLILIAGVILSCADELGIIFRWGGNWDGDGEIISDQNFMDLPHFEFEGYKR